MINEQWNQWIPLDGLSGRIYINSLTEKQTKFEINLKVDDVYDGRTTPPRGRNFRILFQSPVLFYKNVDEYCAIEDTFALREKYGDKFVAESALFQATHSSYLQWLFEESLESLNDFRLKHFMILEESSRIDIITTEIPLVEWIKHVD